MVGIVLNRTVGIVGGGITGLIIGIFLAREGFKVSIFEKNKLLSQTSSKTTKLLHGGLRYLENFQIKEVQNGLKDREWWLKNFPKHTNKMQIAMPFKSSKNLNFFKYFIGIKLYEMLAGSKKIGGSKILDISKYDSFDLKEDYSKYISFFDGSMDDEMLGQELINLAKNLNIDIFENHEVKSFDNRGNIDNYKFDKIILSVGQWTEILLEKNKIKPLKKIDFIKGSHLIINREIKNGIMLKGRCKKRYIFALPYKKIMLLGTTEERVNSPESPNVETHEIEYLLDSINFYLKDPISQNEIVSSYAGVRPLIKSNKKSFVNSSRDFFIQNEDKLIAIYGGKWTTSPSIAREVVTII